MNESEDILAFAEFAANMAWDQRKAWEDARATYFEDLRSTFRDWKITDQHVIAEAERIFNERADALFGV